MLEPAHETRAYESLQVKPDAKFELCNYRFDVASADGIVAYESLVEKIYRPLGFLNEHAGAFLPRTGTSRFVLSYRNEIVGSCGLTRVIDLQSHFDVHIPRQSHGPRPNMMELNNIILIPELRGGIGLALVLYHAALKTLEMKADMVVGITRYQTLRYFVEAGATPVDHDPLHVLGRADIHDFIIFYDLTTPEALVYLRERANRLFHQLSVLDRIRRRLRQLSQAEGSDKVSVHERRARSA